MLLVKRLRARLPRLSAEDGQTLVLVILLIAMLSLLGALLIDTLLSSQTRSNSSATQADARAAAEAGVDNYVSTLLLDNQYYLQYLAPGEATRKSTTTGDVVSSVQPPASPTAWASNEGRLWTYPNGKDAWVDLGNGYSYDLELTPPQTGGNNTNYLQIVATGKANSGGSANDRQVLQVLIRPASVADYFMMTNDNYVLGADATANGKIYAAGEADICGTANADVFSEVLVSTTRNCGGSTGTINANAYSPSTNPSIRSVIASPINFSSFQTSLSDIYRAAKNAGGIYLDSSVYAWQVTFNSNGTVSYRSCTKGTGTGMGGSTAIDAVQPKCTGSITTKNVPTNGAIYSDAPVVIAGGTSSCTDPPPPDGSGSGNLSNANCVNGHVTVASSQDIIVGDDIGYVTDGDDVLGLLSQKDVFVAEWAPTNLTWRGALLAETGQRSQSPDACHNGCHGGTMNFSGSTASYNQPYMDMFANRNYNYDATLQYLQPPWFPTLPQAYTILMYRDLPNPS